MYTLIHHSSPARILSIYIFIWVFWFDRTREYFNYFLLDRSFKKQTPYHTNIWYLNILVFEILPKVLVRFLAASTGSVVKLLLPLCYSSRLDNLSWSAPQRWHTGLTLGLVYEVLYRAGALQKRVVCPLLRQFWQCIFRYTPIWWRLHLIIAGGFQHID